MNYILSIDQGTSSSRALVLNHNGEIITISQKEHTQYFPKPNYVEHNPEEIWENVNILCNDVVKRVGGWSNIKGIGITNQRETVITWDKLSNKILNNAIVWQCRRSTDIIDKIKKENLASMITSKTGLVLDAYFSGSKIQWLIENSNKVSESLKNESLCFGTIDSYLIYKMTGQHVTDTTNASRTMLFNINTLNWDDDLLDLFKVPEWTLPEIYPSFWYGSELLWEKDGYKIPISGIAGDQQSALFGQLAFDSGATKITYGTGNFALENIGSKPKINEKNGLLTTVAWSLGNLKNITYAIEGAVFNTGALIQWLRDGLMIFERSDEVENMAKSVKESIGDLVIIPAFSGLGAPYWNQNARGTILGITRGTTKYHIVKAALESIALQTFDILSIMEKTGQPISEIKVDGGASKNNFLMQLQADILEKKIFRPKNIETTALGVGYLAGLGTGYWSDLNDLKTLNSPDKVFLPNEGYDREFKLSLWSKAIKRSVDWAR